MKTGITAALVAVGIAALGTASVWAQNGFKASIVLQDTKTAVGQRLPVQITASVVEILPGGELGRYRRPNPALVYVLQGTLTVDTDGHAQKAYATGQSFLEAVGLWQNVTNRGTTPVKFLVVFAGEEGNANLVRP